MLELEALTKRGGKLFLKDFQSIEGRVKSYEEIIN